MAREDAAVRAQRVLAILAEHDREWVSLAELAEEFGCDADALQRDLNRAMACGVPNYDAPGTLIDVVFDEEDGLCTVASPGVFSETPRLFGAEGLAVLAAAQTMQQLWPDDAALRTAIGKLEDELDAHDRVQVDVALDEHLGPLLEAEERRMRVRGRYWSKNSDSVRMRALEPLHVFWAMGAWYARCRDLDDGIVKQFRIDAFETVEVTDEAFDPGPVDGDALAFLAPSETRTVRVWFPATAAWVQTDLDVRVRTQSDNGFEAELIAVGTAWLEGLLLQTDGRVIEPADLVDLGVEAARRTLERYC